MSEDLGLVWLHVVSPPGIEEDLDSVSENWGNFGGGGRRRRGARQPGSATANTRANLNGGREARFEEWVADIKPPPAGAQLQAHADAARALAVPARRAPLPAPPNDADPGPVEPVLQGPGPAGRAAPAPLPPDRLRRPELQELAPPEGRGHVGQVADRGGGRPRRGVHPGSATAAGSTRENAGEIAPIPLFIKAPGPEEGRRSTTPTSRRSTSCRRSSTS